MVDWNCYLCKEYQRGVACTYCDSGSEFVRMSNADRIRSMSNEELAEFLCNISMCKPDYCPAYDTCMRTEHGTMKKWLQSEAE